MDQDEKEKNRMMYKRRHGRRQDHGTRGNATKKGCRWFDREVFDEDESMRRELRKTLRRGGVIEEE